ncbi:MAG: ABC transporter ATP-binding protein [Hoeflea sp.]|uniref:ABC transporter ATP-binding protein n=1 Tax=Hoeflea sp. TaxID=1940281 RepID=UPI00329A7B5F
MTLAIELRNISKRFGSIRANRRISFGVESGSIHALVGENGAGKTTLMNVLFGLYQPDEGEILINGEPVVMATPRTAISCGIGMVHQHFKLVPSLTVAENIFLGMEKIRNGLIDTRAQEAEVAELSQRFGLAVDPAKKVADLSVGAEQRVEILKVLARGAKTVILDEPTAVLTPQESRELFTILRGFTAQGMTIIFISHHLDEVMEVSDTVTVIRDGAVVDTVSRDGLTEDDLVRMMVGREVNFSRRPRTPNEGKSALRVSRVCARDGRGVPTLRDVSLEVGAGEIVGVIGVDGNGQTELAEIVAGLREPSHGMVEIAGMAAPAGDPRAARDLGLVHVPADRVRRGVDGSGTIASNILMGRQYDPEYTSAGIVLWSRVRAAATALIERFDIRSSGPDQVVGKLSGGNMQKVVLAREFSHGAPVLLVDQPTRGVDIGAMERIHDEIMEQRDRGAAILLISAQIDEVITLADRILVLFAGRIAGEVSGDTTNEDEIGRLMAGGSLAAEVAA